MIKQVSFNDAGVNCLECSELSGFGVVTTGQECGIWMRCRVTGRLIDNIAVNQSQCPYADKKRDAGDRIMEEYKKMLVEDVAKSLADFYEKNGYEIDLDDEEEGDEDDSE